MKKEALIIVDLQNDFCPGGALEVPDGDRVIEPINNISRGFYKVVLSQDWHPENHFSFASTHKKKAFHTVEKEGKEQTLWPDHCVQKTEGADFHPGLDAAAADLIIRKGSSPSLDSYSAFLENDQKTETGLHYYLKGMGIKDIYVCGLATDFCVYYTCLDGLKQGFNVYLIEDATRGIDQPEGSLHKALEDMREKGVRFLSSNSLV